MDSQCQLSIVILTLQHGGVGDDTQESFMGGGDKHANRQNSPENKGLLHRKNSEESKLEQLWGSWLCRLERGQLS